LELRIIEEVCQGVPYTKESHLSEPTFFVLWFLFIIGIVVFVMQRKVTALKLAAQSVGLGDVQFRFLKGGITGMWQGRSVLWRFRGGGRNGPERAVVEITTAAPSRIEIRRRVRLNFSLFGPPEVQTAHDQEFIVHAEDAMLAQRLLGDASIVEELRQAILERPDELDLRSGRIRVTRVTRSTSRDLALRTAWQLASTVVGRLGLPPAG
jgi:hypothetical protein